jgi:response regulator RpfG family c-di-GMP phosphodiesterase
LGLKGEDIPLPARVFAVVDVWDALTSKRPYRTPVREARAREIIREGAGRDFDPRVVEAFLKLDVSAAGDSRRRASAR